MVSPAGVITGSIKAGRGGSWIRREYVITAAKQCCGRPARRQRAVDLSCGLHDPAVCACPLWANANATAGAPWGHAVTR